MDWLNSLDPETRGFLDKIIANFVDATLTGKISGDKTEQLITLFLLSTGNVIAGQKQAAIDRINEALPILQEIDDKTLQAIALANIGGLYTFMGYYKKAIEFLDRAVPLLKASDQPFYLASALSTLGQVYYLSLERRKGLEYLNQALPLFRQAQYHNFEVNTLVGIALIHSAMGEYKEALNLLNQALSLKKFAEPNTEAAAIIGFGEVHEDMGRGEEALKYFHRAVDICRTAKDRLHEANALNRLGSLYYYRGEREKAVEYFNQALQAAQKSGNRRMEGAVFAKTGAFYHQSGDLHKAIQLYTRAFEIMQSVEDYNGKAVCLSYIGAIYSSLGEFQKALDYYNQALATFRLLEHRRDEAGTLLDIGHAYGSMGEIRKALDYLDEALKISHSIGDPGGEARTIEKMGEFYALLGDRRKSLSSYNQALTIMQSIKDRHGEGSTLGRIGMVYGSSGENHKALSYLNQSLAIARSVGEQINEAGALSDIGSLYEREQNSKTALDFYRQSIDLRERNRAVARLEEFKINLARKDAEVYNRAVLLEMRFKRASQAFDLVERARARSFLDQLGNARPNIRKGISHELVSEERSLVLELALLEERLRQESAMPFSSLNEALILSLESQLSTKRRQYEDLLTRLKVANPEYALLTSVNTLTLPETQKLLNKDTTLLSYFVTPEKTLAFVITRDSFKAVEIAVKEADLKAAITWFCTFPTLRDRKPQSLRQLYGWLIAPVKRYIKTPLLGIVPHGTLHYLPFAALTDGSYYLGDDHAIFYLPSASVLPFIQKKSKPVGSQLLALAQSRAQALPILRHADEEAQSVAALYNAKAFTTANASKAEFLKQAGDYSIIHIAAHAQLNGSNPLFSRVVLGGDKESGDALEVREVYNLDLSKAALVVLSACETQLGALSRGDDIVGLNRAFIYAGSPSVIASLWRVDDESTSYLMRSFYTHLKQGGGKAEALQAAQAETRKRYAPPYFWAGFVLSGDPGPLTSAKAGRAR